MKKRKIEQAPSKAPLFIGVMCMALAAGIGAYIMGSPGQRIDKPAATTKVEQTHKDEVKVYTPRYEGDSLKLDPSVSKPKPTEDARVFAVNQYLSGVKAVPQKARAVKCEVSNGIATLDFTPEFETSYGTEDEQTILKGLLTVMAQFDGVQKVKFTVQGRTLESIGNVDLTEPQPVMQEEPASSPPKSSAQIQ